MSPLVSVVIPTFSGPSASRHGRLRLALAGFATQTLRRDSFEIVVVDDGSAHGGDGVSVQEAIDSWRLPFAVRVLRQPHGGLCAAYNLGIERADGRLVLLGLDDHIPCPAFLEEHVRLHERARHRTLVAGREKNLTYCAVFRDPTTGELERPTPRSFRRLVPGLEFAGLSLKPIPPALASHGFATLDYLARDSPAFADLQALPQSAAERARLSWLAMRVGNLSCDREFLREVGMFDAAFGTNGWYNDLELGYRLVQAGARFVVAERAVTLHLCHRRANAEFAGRAQERHARGRFLAKAPRLEVALLPLKFDAQLTLREYGTVTRALARRRTLRLAVDVLLRGIAPVVPASLWLHVVRRVPWRRMAA